MFDCTPLSMPIGVARCRSLPKKAGAHVPKLEKLVANGSKLVEGVLIQMECSGDRVVQR